MGLEKELNSAFESLNISKEQQSKLKHYLNLIIEKDKSIKEEYKKLYPHSLAVGLKMMDKVEDKKAGLYCGILHDIGKLFIEDEILKKDDFNEKDMEIMKSHPEYGFLILGDAKFAFSALVSLLHHINQKNSYPLIKNLSTIIGSKNPASLEKAKQYAHILHEIDAGDARMHRKNNYQE